ncbi:MAG: GNAT family N-acetyltransferase [Gemmatimonadales bacterium]|nr:GNAT family N-acetyltransferase [Gemmatimonadales bacterium]
MPDPLRFDPLCAADLPTIAAWWTDPWLRRRLEAPTTEWLEYVEETDGVQAWVVREGDEAVAVIQFEADSEWTTATFDIAVCPTARGRGIGVRAITALLDRPDVRGLARIEVDVEHDNVAARRTVEKAGFVLARARPDAEGFVAYLIQPTGR